jgi:hypothetical protein
MRGSWCGRKEKEERDEKKKHVNGEHMKMRQFKEDREEQKHDSHPPCVQVVVALVDCFCHLLHPGGIILLVYSN